jgi:hypothetical protein
MAKEETNRYQRGWDEAAKADWLDSAVDTLSSVASTRADASWDSSAASQSGDIPY